MKYSIIPVLAFATMAFAIPTTLEARDGAPEINEALDTQNPPEFKWPDNLVSDPPSTRTTSNIE